MVPIHASRAHQVPLAEPKTNPGQLAALEQWLRSYRPEELFDAEGRPVAEVRAATPAGHRRMGANTHANGGIIRKALRMPDFRDYVVPVEKPCQSTAWNTRPLGAFLRHVMRANMTSFVASAPSALP